MVGVDWSALSAAHDGYFESVDGRSTRRALAQLVGDEVWRDAVDTYVSGRPGHGAAHGVIRFVRPVAAFERCLEIYRDERVDIEHRRMAVNLAASAADADNLAWATNFLDDPDDLIQVWGAKMLDELWMAGALDPDQLLPLVRRCLDHPNPHVRARAASVLSMILDDESDTYEEDEAAFVAMWSDPVPLVQEQALNAASVDTVGRHLAELRELLQHENAAIRLAAADAVTAQPSVARDLLETLRTDPDESVRVFVEEWLEEVHRR